MGLPSLSVSAMSLFAPHSHALCHACLRSLSVSAIVLVGPSLTLSECNVPFCPTQPCSVSRLPSLTLSECNSFGWAFAPSQCVQYLLFAPHSPALCHACLRSLSVSAIVLVGPSLTLSECNVPFCPTQPCPVSRLPSLTLSECNSFGWAFPHSQ